jgi:hypothetical protein
VVRPLVECFALADAISSSCFRSTGGSAGGGGDEDGNRIFLTTADTKVNLAASMNARFVLVWRSKEGR